MTSEQVGEWFEAIATWPERNRRAARVMTTAFLPVVALPLALWAALPAAPSLSAAPWPNLTAEEFLSGKSMSVLENHFRETSWVTYALRGAHEEALRTLGVPPARNDLGQFDYETSNGDILSPRRPSDLARAQGFVVPVPWVPPPRPRTMIAPNQTFWLRYHDNNVLRRDWFDAQDRVKVRINQYGLREREEILETKPPGQRRVVCIGDSLVFGWGVPEEATWVRLVENELRKSDDALRTVNCGGTMAVCADEYAIALEKRFGAFGPDVVVVALGLNDLVGSNTLALFAPGDASHGGLSDVLNGRAKRTALDLDPSRDWVKELLALPKAEGEAGGLYDPTDRPFEAMWSQGVPQASMRAMKAWCEAHGAGFVVTLWPFLQGLGPGRQYVFQRLHELVAESCRTDGITLVDVLPLLRDHPQEDLWVTPADMHPNPTAHRLAAPTIAAAVQAALPR